MENHPQEAAVRRETLITATMRHAPVTSALIATNALVFGLEELWGGSEASRTLFEMGAAVSGDALVRALPTTITYGYLHIGLLHFFMNMYALLVLGRDLEPMLGHGRFFVLYTCSMIGGGAFVHLFSNSLTAGASGAIFGLLGAISFMWMLAYRASKREDERAYIRKNVLMMLLPNIVISLLPGVSFAGHAGGLLVGLTFVGIAYLRARGRPRAVARQNHVMNVLAAVLALVSLAAIGFVWAQSTPWNPHGPF